MEFKKEINAFALINKLRHAIDIPFQKKISFSHGHILTVGILGVGMGVAGIYMTYYGKIVENLLARWASEARGSPKIVISVAGLQNLGNNCFLNVVLQALASCKCFYLYLQEILQNEGEEFNSNANKMPLIVALESLMKALSSHKGLRGNFNYADLHSAREEDIVLSPRKVMIAMGLYVSGFNLTRQQDAAEAFLHLLSSLQEELLECHVPCCSSLVDIIDCPNNFSSLKDERQNELRHWQQRFYGPFDGTIGSKLFCTNCSSELSIDFEVFRCLPLSPVLDINAVIMDGCTVADCLKQFTTAEHLRSYSCNQCWHTAAMKILSFDAEGNAEKIKIISNCSKLDSCDCKNLFLCDTIQSIGPSHAFKQLCIARCPKILCLHLQRASLTPYGELVKLEGHISFPLFLDIFPYTAVAKKVGFRNIKEDDLQKSVWSQRSLPFHLRHFNLEMAPFANRSSPLHSSHGCSVPTDAQKDVKADSSCLSTLSGNYMYHLTSVVEHYGKCGSGHYAAYRRLRTDLTHDESLAHYDNLDQHWVYVSDGEVSRVSLETVLAAEASLLIYERLETSKS